MLTPVKVLDNYFLEVRCMLLEIAATLDRFDRAVDHAEDKTPEDPRLAQLYESLSILADKNAGSDRSEKLLLLFSDPKE